jgi:hypothetical protein
MNFQIHGLPKTEFAGLFELSDEQLSSQQARRMTIDEFPGAPCRVSLTDVPIGETVILTHYQHHNEDSPYRASHAIFVSESAEQATLAPGEIPPVLSSRLLSVRAFSAAGDMTDADIVDGEALRPMINRMLADSSVEYLHIHFAKRGCFGARVTRCLN